MQICHVESKIEILGALDNSLLQILFGKVISLIRFVQLLRFCVNFIFVTLNIALNDKLGIFLFCIVEISESLNWI